MSQNTLAIQTQTVITEENAGVLATLGEGIVAMPSGTGADDGPATRGVVDLWYGSLAQNTGAAIAYANARHLGPGHAAFSMRDNGQVWVFSFQNPSVLPPRPPGRWYADLAGNTRQATDYASALQLGFGAASFSIRDNGQVWVFSFR
jgi:hypothetical protein